MDKSLDRYVKPDVGILFNKFNDNTCFRVELLGLLMRAALTSVTFTGVRMVFFIVQASFFNAKPVSPKLIVHNLTAIADITKSRSLRLKRRRN